LSDYQDSAIFNTPAYPAEKQVEFPEAILQQVRELRTIVARSLYEVFEGVVDILDQTSMLFVV
jgi:hypothetical protein